jgi:hypothetical protein
MEVKMIFLTHLEREAWWISASLALPTEAGEYNVILLKDTMYDAPAYWDGKTWFVSKNLVPKLTFFLGMPRKYIPFVPRVKMSQLGCRSTFSDININTKITWELVINAL